MQKSWPFGRSLQSRMESVFFLALVEDRECKAKLYSVTERAFAELRVSKSLFGTGDSNMFKQFKHLHKV